MSHPAPERRRRFVDLSPLRTSRSFAWLWIGGAVAGVGTQLTIVASGLQIYDITRDTFAVALVGGIALVPMIVAGLWGGMLADAVDRKTLLLVTALLSWLATLGLVVVSAVDAAVAAQGDRVAVWPFYVLTTLNAVTAVMQMSTRQAITPRILPADMVSRAAALGGIAIGFQVTLGPALAGVLVATVGFAWTFAADAVLFLVGLAGILQLPRLPPLMRAARPGLESLVDGIRFLRRAPNIRMSFLVDIVAMTFGRPIALFPAVGATVIGGGATTVGIITAAFAIGAFLASLFSGPVAHIHRHGVAIGRAISLYGMFGALFGIVILLMQTGWFGPVGPTLAGVSWPALILAALAVTGMGASDEISAIFRSTMLLTAAPDEMRGRLQGVFTVVVTGGPRVGDLWAGVGTALVALWFPSLVGGLLTIALIAILLRVVPSFRAYDARDPSL